MLTEILAMIVVEKNLKDSPSKILYIHKYCKKFYLNEITFRLFSFFFFDIFLGSRDKSAPNVNIQTDSKVHDQLKT